MAAAPPLAPSASASASSKRQSILPPVSSAGPRAPIAFSSSLTIADSALLSGTHLITVSSESVIHPRARIDSRDGPVTIGRRCIVHERTHLGASSSASTSSSSAAAPSPLIGREGGARTAAAAEAGLVINDCVTVEVGAVVEGGGTVIGEGTTVGIGSRIGRGATIGKYCTLTPHTMVSAEETVPDFTVVYSNGMRRPDKRGTAELRGKAQQRQVEVLRRMIPSNPAKFQ